MCETIISLEEAEKMVEARPGFHLLSYTRSDNQCTILHDGCGKTFECKFRKFMKFSGCRACGTYHYADGGFEEHVKELVGNEYTVLTSPRYATETVRIFHAKCGTIKAYAANRFLMGQRCHKCGNEKCEVEFRDLVESLSQGRYQITEMAMKQRYKLRDTSTGQIKTYRKKDILQALKTGRPVDEQATYQERIAVPTTKTEIVIQYLHENYEKQDLIFLEDVKPEGMEYKQVKNVFKSLLMKGVVLRLRDGVYSFEEQVLDPERYLNERYIMRKGKRIGSLYGQSLAFELGIFQQRPDTVYIMTNKESLTHGRKKTIMDRKVRIKGCEYVVDENNYRILQVLDMLRMRYRFGWPVYDALVPFVLENEIAYQDFKLFLDAYADHVRNDLADLYSMVEEVT